MACPLAYPQKFHAAVTYVNKILGDADLSEESKLLLYALQQQAKVGPCNEPRPWGWNVVSNAKWQSWKQLGDMAATEAMRLYVRTLEEELPDWWSPDVAAAMENEEPSPLQTENGDSSLSSSATNLNTSRSSVNAVSTLKSRSVAEVVVEGSWVSPYIASDRRPPPRYEQAMALVGNYLYVIGGNCGGRYLADTWALNLENLTWNCISSAPPSSKSTQEDQEQQAAASLSPIAGHATVPWNGNIVCIGGHVKERNSTDLPVRLFDTQARVWSTLTPSIGDSVVEGPRPRGGHSATLIGSKVYVFGGEDAKRKPVDELWTLDLATLEWNQPETSGALPAPRSAHTACAYRNRYIIYFGGGSVATCYDDLVVLDTQTMEWMTPEYQGPLPPARAGHAAAILGSVLYVVGGGNNARGCADMYSLDLTNVGAAPLQWTLVGNTPPESAIAAEGLSLICVPMAGCMISFGGYNGRYHNAVHVYRPEGFIALKSSSSAGAVESRQPSIGGVAPPPPNTTNQRENSEAPLPHYTHNSAANMAADVDTARREAASAKEAVALEISIMRRQLDSATAAVAEAERAAEEAREALAAEQQKSMVLEVEVAELRQRLVQMGEIEKELSRYRQRESDDASKKPGIWGFITGADQAAKE